MVREGGCECGAVRYQLKGQPVTLYACHCTNCQTRSGSAFALQLVVLETDLAILRGIPEASGETGRRKRCAACGVGLWAERRVPGALWVRAGTLDDTRWLKPVAHVWTRSAQPWFVLPEGTKAFETQPDDPLELVRLWQEANPPQ